MPIVELKNEAAPIAVIQCIVCKKNTEHVVASLQLGTSSNTDAIALTPCSCGAVETLFRTHDDVRGAHREAVNALAHHLRSDGRVHPEAFPAVRAEKVRPQHIRPLIGPV
jgi:hypothetical protein